MKDKEIIEEIAITISGSTEIDTIEYYNALIKAKQIYEIIFPEDSVVLSSNELKRLETNYKIGLGKSQSWCKSLKNRIEELEKENFKLKVDNEVLKEEKEQFENDVCNYEMNLQHLTQELENKSKETAEKILNETMHIPVIEDKFVKVDDLIDKLKEIATREGVEIKEL